MLSLSLTAIEQFHVELRQTNMCYVTRRLSVGIIQARCSCCLQDDNFRIVCRSLWLFACFGRKVSAFFFQVFDYGALNQSIFPPYFCDPVYSLYGQLDFLYDRLFTSYMVNSTFCMINFLPFIWSVDLFSWPTRPFKRLIFYFLFGQLNFLYGQLDFSYDKLFTFCT